MIRSLLRLSDDDTRRLLQRLLTLITITGILQGVGFVLLVPLLQALFAVPGDPSAAGDVLAAWAWLAGVGFIYIIATCWANILGQRSATHVLISLENRIGDRLAELPLGWFGPERGGQTADLATRGVIFAASAPYAILRPILHAFLVPVTITTGTLFINWQIALTFAVTAPIMWFTYRKLSALLKDADARDNHSVAQASSRIVDFARSQPAVRMAGTNSIAQQLVDSALAHQHAQKRHHHIIGAGGISAFAIIAQFALILVVVVGTYLALDGSLDAAALIALLVLGVRFIEPVTDAAALSGGIGMAQNTLEAIQTLIDTPNLPEPTSPAQPDDSSVRLENVTFGYGGAPVVRGLSFDVPAGTTTAIVGPSGAGKTTITRLIARFYDPEDGQVLLGGIPLPELGTDQVFTNVASIFQDGYLFDDTIFANVQLGRPDATHEEVIDAARLARVDEIAERLPDGWNSRVGEGGSSLSGGERQRICIARALLKDTPVFLLDEATAALDAQNEEAIQAAISHISKDRTVIVVAHRLQTILGADQIIMLSPDGTIAEHGTHEELVALGGSYARFWEERLNAQGWRILSKAPRLT